jgi:predicted CoA-binding protein
LSTGQYQVQFVNPALQQVLGQSVYPSLQALPTTPDLVVVFRRAEDLPDVLADTLAAQAGALWIQLGIVNQAVANEAQAAGVSVVMDRCIMVEHRRLLGF